MFIIYTEIELILWSKQFKYIKTDVNMNNILLKTNSFDIAY